MLSKSDLEAFKKKEKKKAFLLQQISFFWYKWKITVLFSACSKCPWKQLLTYISRLHHISHILASLHRLPALLRIGTFKTCCRLASSYMAELLTPDEPVCQLRSSAGALLSAPKPRLKSHDFCHQGPSALEWPAWGDARQNLKTHFLKT